MRSSDLASVCCHDCREIGSFVQFGISFAVKQPGSCRGLSSFRGFGIGSLKIAGLV